MSQTFTIPVSPNVVASQSLPATGKVSVVDLANSSAFDITYVGFGAPGEIIIEAGTKVRLHAEVLNTGQFSMLPKNNAGVTGTGTVNVTVYFVNESVPPGTFPVAIPTQIVTATVSGVQTLSNETSTLGAEIIDIGQGSNTRMVDIFNDHFIWSVIQAGVAHQVMKGQTSGTPLLLGQAGDNLNILGQLLINQNATFLNNISLRWQDHLGTTRIGLTVDPSDNLDIIANLSDLIQMQDHLFNVRNTFQMVSPFLTSLAGTLTVGAVPSVTRNGSVSGTITLYEQTFAQIKFAVFIVSNFSDAADQTFLLPTAFTTTAFGFATTTGGGWHINSGVTNQNINHLLTLGVAGTSGTHEAVIGGHSDWVFFMNQSFDTIKWDTNPAATGAIFLFGV